MKIFTCLSFTVLILGAHLACAGETLQRIVPTTSMEPTLLAGSLIEIRIDEQYQHTARRFDIIAYTNNADPTKREIFLKRLVGLSGEEIETKEGEIRINGVKLDVPKCMSLRGLNISPIKRRLSENECFVLGDFTENSMDSRFTGPIKKDQIVGYYLRVVKNPGELL